MALVYAHKRLDKNEYFYIGVQLDSTNKYGYRPYVKSGKSKLWNNIVNKTNYEVIIIKDNLSNQDALNLEIDLIKLYGRLNEKSGILVNLTNGGEGITGFKHSEDTKTKMRNSAKLRGISKETHMKIAESRKGKIYNNKKVINTKTLEVYNSVKELSTIIGINKVTLTNWLNGTRTNKSIYTYLNNFE